MNLIYTMWNWLVRGGPVMIPIIGFSVIAVSFIIERFIHFNKIRHNVEDFTEKVTELLEQNKLQELKEFCQTLHGPLPKMVEAAVLTQQKNPQFLRERVHEVVVDEIPKLEKNLSSIATIATIEPMLGLLGTVIGMIRSFTVIALEGTGDPQALAGGISEALITTQAGLIVAIPLLYFHNILSDKVDKAVASMEKVAIRIISVTGVNKNG